MDLVHQLTPIAEEPAAQRHPRNPGSPKPQRHRVEALVRRVPRPARRGRGRAACAAQAEDAAPRAAFDPQKTLETFDFAACPKLSQKEIADLATCRFVERHENVFFVGPAGVGKSHLAQALGHEACRRGYDVLFMPAARALAQLAAGRADGTYERRLASFARAHLLILDDFGLKPLRPPAPEDLYEIVAERYEKGSMIVTSNRVFAEWARPLRRAAPRQRRPRPPRPRRPPDRDHRRELQDPRHPPAHGREEGREPGEGGRVNGSAWISMHDPGVDQIGVSLTPPRTPGARPASTANSSTLASTCPSAASRATCGPCLAPREPARPGRPSCGTTETASPRWTSACSNRRSLTTRKIGPTSAWARTLHSGVRSSGARHASDCRRPSTVGGLHRRYAWRQAA